MIKKTLFLVPESSHAAVKYFNKFFKFHGFLKMDVSPKKMLLNLFVDPNTPQTSNCSLFIILYNKQ